MDIENRLAVERVAHEGDELALIIRSDYQKDGIEFFTPGDYSQQLAYMHHKKGHIIAPHIHNHMAREVRVTQEVLVIKKGSLRVDFYTRDRQYLKSRILNAGDVILLASGGHGFEALDDLEMLEIKQGPYLGSDDKVRFESSITEIKYE